MRIRIVASGRFYHWTEHLPDELEVPGGASLDTVLERLTRLLPPEGQLPATCLVAVAGRHVGTVGAHENRSLADGDELVLISPVAGG